MGVFKRSVLEAYWGFLKSDFKKARASKGGELIGTIEEKVTVDPCDLVSSLKHCRQVSEILEDHKNEYSGKKWFGRLQRKTESYIKVLEGAVDRSSMSVRVCVDRLVSGDLTMDEVIR